MVWAFDWLPARVDIEVDEMMAIAEGLRGGAGQAANLAANEGGGAYWLWVAAVLIGLVLGMLLILVGQQRRLAQKRNAEPSFEGFEVEDDADGYNRFDDLATVEIEEPVVDERSFEERVAAVVSETSENVVPIRQLEPAQPPQPAAEPAELEPEPARYAFAAGGGAQMSADAPPSTLVQRTSGAAGGYESSYRGGGKTMNGQRFGQNDADGTDDDAPFVAPFIREDIERSERRQADRIDGLRDEVHRQFQTMKNENAARLDLFVSTVDRKLDNVRGGEGLSEAALQHAVEAALRPVFDRLDGVVSHVATQERRLNDLAVLIERRLPDLMNTGADIQSLSSAVQGTREDLGRTAELMRGQVSEIGGGMDTLRETIERLERALLDRASAEGEANVALTEVVRGTLPEGTYEFGKRLANGNTADCVISFEGSRERVAIDAGFPMEAFSQLPSRDAVSKNLPQAKAAEDVFRRAILRAILEAADRCIVPGDTTDSCLLFLPSEAAYTVLHDRFGDLVRDAQRARVWLTSPSTLMGTLNLLRNLMPEARTAETEAAPKPAAPDHGAREKAAREKALADEQRRLRAEAERREKEREAMRAEIRALRERAAGLAGELDRTRGTLSDLIETTDRLSAREDEPRRASVQVPHNMATQVTPETDYADDTLPALRGWAEDDRDDPFEDE